ncbi:MAG: helix-turn-helix domain-containing protein [Bacteroidetes bacterium]|nr:helix-turn-helix domain-containing protein [Bacteroidota bacterium]
MNNPASPAKPLTAKEAADYLDLSISMLYRHVREGRIPAFKPNGKKWYFWTEDLDRWIRGGTPSSSVTDADAARTSTAGNGDAR